MLYVFEYIYENYRIITLPNDWRVWLISLLVMEFMFYCAHRLLHEVNFLWASHQYHHSCKHFNIGTAVRLSWFELNIVYYYTSLLAMAIPPPIMITHMQYMFLYQAWLHTDTIGKLGFLEYVFNTPSHHRVHHVIFELCFEDRDGGQEPLDWGIWKRYQMQSMRTYPA
ncbi:unnamed protein product [Oppiella nova]|uniref:Fatty acid hydroxylase domain-containing protein n=1 Tax=Oppiella nova TaxID=334625 RepID=A0A7R9LMD8_9ACAR|nr:unnamed protein product [Oppiella nova]CAG2164980.1 unnamed protein product [Oppiella nova]